MAHNPAYSAPTLISAPPELVAVTAHDLLAANLPPRENLIDPWLPRQGLCLLYAKRGVGKTHVALSIAYAVATGSELMRWRVPEPRKVLYIDGEMCASLLQRWFAEIVEGFDAEPPDPDYLQFITPDMQDGGIPDLASEQGREAIEPHVAEADLIIIDNKSTLCRSGRENEAESWLPMQDWMLSLRRRGKSVLMLHHANKAGQSRGTSMIEVVLDTVIALRHPHDYEPSKGLVAEVHFEKHRALFGDDVEPFEISYETRENVGIWSHRGLADVDLQRVVSLHNDGVTIQRDIGRDLDMSLGKVNRLINEAKSMGVIK
jgi:putative DNA primase/helicase